MMDDQIGTVKETHKTPSKYKQPVAIIVILLIIVLVCLSYYFNPFQKSISSILPSSVSQKEKVPTGWLEYKNDILGLSFSYPEEWGEPYVNSPTSVLTHLKDINEQFGQGGYPNVSIYFKGEHTPQILIVGDNFEGQSYPNAFAMSYGSADNFPELVKSGDICKYKIAFDHRPDYPGTIEEIFTNCKDYVKTSLTKNMQAPFDMPNVPRILYNYQLYDYAFTKLHTGYIDNVFIKYFYSADQTPSADIGIDHFTNNPELPYAKNHKKFVEFVGSIKTYTPFPIQSTVFQNISGEDLNITTIRQYYYRIATGKIQGAYDMYLDKKVSFDEYTKWYKNVFKAEPTGFHILSNGNYQFNLTLQNKNKVPESYRITLQVMNDKIVPISSELITALTFFSDNISAFISTRQSKSSLIFSSNGEESIIDELTARSEQNPIAGDSIASLKFSPSGNYLIAHTVGWEWFGQSIYDIKNKKKVLHIDSPSTSGFTIDEKYFYACAASDFGGVYYGTVYEVPSFKVKYALPEDFINANSISSCDYNENGKVVKFTSGEKTISFSILTGQVN